MSADALKSASITNLDLTPPTANNTGAGASGYTKNVTDYVTPTTGGLVDTTSKYKMVRLPSNCKVKKMQLTADGALDSSTGLALDVGAYYSDSTQDQTNPANQGVAISVNCFAAAITTLRSSAVGPVDAFGAYSVAARNQPLWQGLGLSSDPGGFIDVVVAVHTAATTAASAKLGINVDYVE